VNVTPELTSSLVTIGITVRAAGDSCIASTCPALVVGEDDEEFGLLPLTAAGA